MWGLIVLPCFLFKGAAHDPEETVVTDQFTGSARERELPEREKQFARHAAEGKKSLCLLKPSIFSNNHLKTISPRLQERDKLVSLEGKYAELSEGQSFTNVPVAIKEVGVSYSYNNTSYIHQQRAPLLFLCKWSSSQRGLSKFECLWGELLLLLFCDRCSTCSLWRKGGEAAVETLPTRVTASLTRGASSSPRLTADPWDAHFLPRLLLFFILFLQKLCEQKLNIRFCSFSNVIHLLTIWKSIHSFVLFKAYSVILCQRPYTKNDTCFKAGSLDI